MYAADERFRANYGALAEGLSGFIRDTARADAARSNAGEPNAGDAS